MIKELLCAVVIALIGLLFVLPSGVKAQQYVKPDQSTVAWDANEEATGYKVYTAVYKNGDISDIALLNRTTSTTYVVTIPTTNAMYVVGVSSTLTGADEEIESEINWSHTEEGTPNPFVYVNVVPPVNLRRIN